MISVKRISSFILSSRPASTFTAALLLLLSGLPFFTTPLMPAGSISLPRFASPAYAEDHGKKAPVHGYRIVRIYPHDPQAFTQGLLFSKGFLFESTGLNGRSTVRKVELETGKVLKSHSLPRQYFGEGLAEWKGKLIQLTWRSQVGFIYDMESFEKVGEFSYQSEGWGLTSTGEHLVMSDGSDTLRFLDPETHEEVRRVQVKDGGAAVTQINELEYIKGEIFANVWNTNYIVRISPKTGEVLGWVDLSGLQNALGPVMGIDVLNGIAFDAKGGRIFVTGKLWPKLFEVEITEQKP
jgi:glutaminyl-peptide cyclotransferase